MNEKKVNGFVWEIIQWEFFLMQNSVHKSIIANGDILNHLIVSVS